MKAAWILTLAVMSLLGAGYCLSREAVEDPVYKGKRYSEWLISRSKDRAEALDAIGTNAVPYLLHELSVRDSFLRAMLIEKAPPRVTALLNLRSDNARHGRAYCAFLRVAKEAECAVPGLREMLKDPEVAPRAISVLGCIGERAEAAAPALVRCLSTPDPQLRRRVRMALRKIRPEPEVIMEPLEELFADPDFEVRLAATNVMKQVRR